MNSPPLNSSKKNRKKKKKKAKPSTGANVDAGLEKVHNGYGDSCTCGSGSKDDTSSESLSRRCSECNKEARSSPQVVQCTCPSCAASRDLTHASVGIETDMSSTQSYWMEIRHIVRNIYRSTNSDNKPILNTEKMKNIVKKLCRGDPHQFFQRLETLAREYLLEVKVRLLEQLSLGFNSPQLAISFIEMLLDEYFTLADALPYLHQLLQPLEDSRYVDNLKLTVDLMNKNIFRELIFAESFMSSNLPLIIAQLRLASLSSDAHHRVMADKLNQQYSELDQEMEEIGHLWRAAKSDFAGFPPSIPIDQAHIEEIRSDAESLKKMKQQQKQQQSKSQDPPPAKAVTSKMVNEVVMPPSEEPKSFSACGLTNTQLCSKIKPLESIHLDSSGRTLKPSELSTILYHCMKPVGDADTVLEGDQVLQTYTLKLELSKLDLSNISTEGHLSENDRYKDLGFSEEEMNDINLKLNALKAIGLDLQLEDLLDSGISLVEQNKAGMNGLQHHHSNGTSHLPNGKVFEGMWKKNGGVVAAEDMNGTTSLSHTLFDDLVLKLRMSKKLTKKELEHYHLHGPEGVQFSCQDEAQLQVVRISNVSANGNCVGTFLGLEKECGDPMDNELFNTMHHHEVVRVLQQQLERCTHERDSVEALKSRGLVTTGKMAASKCEKLEKMSPSFEKALVQKETEEGGSNCKGTVTCTDSSQPSDVDLSKLKPVIVPSNNPCQCTMCIGARAANNCSHSETVMHSVHKIQLTPGHNFIALAQEKPTKPLRPGEAPKTHLLHYKLDSKDIQQSSSGNTGGVEEAGAVANGSDQAICHNHSINHGDSGYEEDACSMESSKSSVQFSPDCDNCRHHNHHHHHHHHGHHHHGHQHCGDPCTSSQTNSSSNNTSGNHVDDMSSSSSSASLKTSSAANGSNNVAVSGTGGGNSNNNGGTGRTYCRCCYCELFGHSGPPTAPTSHNYTKQRDKMRVKLEMKKQRDTGNHGHCSCSNVNNNSTRTVPTDCMDDRSLDTLLEFINGPEEENQKLSSRAAKRQRRKQRKQESNHHNAEDESDHKQNDSSSTGKKEGSKKGKLAKKGQQMLDSEVVSNVHQKEEAEVESSDEEAEKERSQVGSDHSSEDLEISAEMTIHSSSSQEFKLATSGSKFEKHQEKNHGGKLTNNEAYSVSITCGASNCVKAQAHNQKVSQQHLVQPQQSTTQKPRPANAVPTAKPTDQYITMSSRRQQSTSPSQQQTKEMEKAEVGQKFYSSDYNSRAPSSQRQVAREKDTVTRDNREARFHYAPNPNRIKQLPPRFQRMAQEQLANQQQQQQQQLQHSRSSRYNTVAHSNSMPANPQAPTQKKDNGHMNNVIMDDVFMPKDDLANGSDEEMDEIDRELEEFKRFCFMAKPLENRPKVAVKVNLKDLTLKKP